MHEDKKIIKKISSAMLRIQSFMAQNVENSGSQITAFGIILTINYPVYYFIWLYASYQSYENLFLRLSASFFCSLLIVQKYWPRKLKIFLPVYWYATVTYVLPFFFTFMLLKNNASTMWLMNSVSVLFFVILLFDALSAAIIISIGISLAFFCYLMTSASQFIFDPGTVNLSGIISTLAAAFTIGAIFAHNKEKSQNEKLRTIATVGESIAHELRTPLRTITSGAAGIRNFLPQLIGAYQIAREAKLPVPEIDAMHYEALKPSLDSIESEVEYAFNFINMLLINSDRSKINRNKDLCSMANCIEQALVRYPFDPEDRALVQWKRGDDFVFSGDELLTTHVLFNLLKNAIHYVRSAGKGKIEIWLEHGVKTNILHFKDTGQGIPAKILPYVFDRFFSNTRHGAGIGLAFCKLVMQSNDGDIVCDSKEGEYTEFILTFPK